MGGISRDGYGLLSPTIFQSNDQHQTPITLLMGIVPDKLPTQTNYEMGWAHNYSLPREITLAADGTLVQKPYSGLSGMRTSTAFNMQKDLLGTESLSPVNGRQIELLGEFTIASGSCGFNFLKSGGKQASLAYDTEKGTLTLDLTSLNRTANDNNVYNGIYTASLPRKVNAGEQLTLHVFLDGSIADIFVNNTWAFSVRLFPNDADAIEAEAFATSATTADIKAWVLDASLNNPSAISQLPTPNPQNDQTTKQPNDQTTKRQNDPTPTYDLFGHQLTPNTHSVRRFSRRNPTPIIIQNGKKYVAR